MWGEQPQGATSQNRLSRTSYPFPREGLQSQREGVARVGCEKPPSPLEALLLQQALEGGQVPHVGRIVQPGVLAVLDGVVAKLLPQPLLQVTTCAGERRGGAGLSPAQRLLGAAGSGEAVPSLPGTRRARKEPLGQRRAHSRQHRPLRPPRYLPARLRRRAGPRHRGGRPPPSAPRTAGPARPPSPPAASPRPPPPSLPGPA